MAKEKYKQIEDKLFSFLDTHPDQIYKSRELARHLRVPNRNYQQFKKTVRHLAEEGRLSRYKGNKYGRLRKPIEVTGILHVKTQGYGFVFRDDQGEDVFVSQKNMGTALHRDRVKVLLWAQPVGKLPEGKVVEVLKRGYTRIVGTFQEAGTYHVVIPDELKLSRDIYVSESDRGEAKAGQKVVVEITKWGNGRRLPEGKVMDVLGLPEEKGVDVLSVIHTFGLPLGFPRAVEREMKALPEEISDPMWKNRLDLRDTFIFTIDPEDAKDFDDAVSLEHTASGNYLLGVHIADVSAFVPIGSATDLEALKRGSSVYLVDRVIPMLPHRLSNELCSLKPLKDRLTLSVLMELTPEGVLENYQIRESLIHSRYRLTYKEVHGIIHEFGKAKSQKRQDHFFSSSLGYEGSLVKTLLDMADLSQCLLARWREEGSIDFDAPEAEVVLDTKGRPVDLKIKARYESHKLIEAFMLLANKTVAEHIQKVRLKTGRKFPFVYRVHEKPQGKKLESFVLFVRALGYSFDPGEKMTPKKFQSLLKQVEGTKHEMIVKEVALRTMMKAVYSTKNVGHFGLAFKQYTHFTSPIRRYPDLMVHRLLKMYCQEKPELPKLPAKLSEICQIATEREITAQEAERESVKIKQVEFMENRTGESFEGVISGVAPFGIFVEITEYLVEGLVPIKALDDDYYVFDEKGYSLIGQNRGNSYRLGDPVRVRVARVFRDMRKIDFNLIGEYKNSALPHA